MDRDKIIGGILLISIGTIFLLINLGFLSWSVFNSFIQLWPLILVVFGVNIIFKNNTIVSALTWILFFGIIIGYGIYYDTGYKSSTSGLDHLTIEKHYAAETAELNLKLGGLRFDIGASDHHIRLVEAAIDKRYVNHRLDQRNNHKHSILSFESKSSGISLFERGGSHYLFYLNKDIPWSINADIGAVSGSMNLQELEVKDVDLKIGAGNLELILGDNSPLTEIKIDGGASNLDIILSKSMAAKIKVAGGLNKTNIARLGWSNTGDYYISPGYEEALSKAIIEIDAGVANINIVRR